jgi:hypothetical protein
MIVGKVAVERRILVHWFIKKPTYGRYQFDRFGCGYAALGFYRFRRPLWRLHPG